MGRLSANEKRTRAQHFVQQFATARRENGESISFYRCFFTVFGLGPQHFTVCEHAVEKLGTARGFVDLFYPGRLIVEQKGKIGH